MFVRDLAQRSLQGPVHGEVRGWQLSGIYVFHAHFSNFFLFPMLLPFHPRPVNPLKLAYSRGTTPQDYTLETGVLRNSSKRYNSSNCDSGFGGQKPLVIQAIQAFCFRRYLGRGSTTDNKGITSVFIPWVYSGFNRFTRTV